MKREIVYLVLKSFDHKLLRSACATLRGAIIDTGAQVSNIIALPREFWRCIVNTSPHVHKKAREQYEIRIHKLLIIVLYPTQDTMSTLQRLDVPGGIDVAVKCVFK